MPRVFRDKEGNVLMCDGGQPDPESYARGHRFQDGWTFEDITDEESMLLWPQTDVENLHLPDPPHEQIRKLKSRNEALTEVLEEVLKLSKDELKTKIEEKLEKVKKEGIL